MQQASQFSIHSQPLLQLSPMLPLLNQSPPMIDQIACERSEMEKYAVLLQVINTRKDLIEYSNFLFELHFYVKQFFSMEPRI
jgi:hypothetical protein